MSLNIKNPRVHDLARQASQRTGLTQTSVIELALERLLSSLPAADTELDALIHEVQTRIAAQGPLTCDDLYDEQGGLPR